MSQIGLLILIWLGSSCASSTLGNGKPQDRTECSIIVNLLFGATVISQYLDARAKAHGPFQ